MNEKEEERKHMRARAHGPAGHEQLIAAGLREQLDAEPLPPGQIEAGTPSTAAAEIGGFAGCELGVWEVTPGICSDTEADEVFIVLRGRARIEFLGGGPAPAPGPLDIGPGDIVRLHEGQRTRWTVRETLRKVYLLPGAAS